MHDTPRQSDASLLAASGAESHSGGGSLSTLLSPLVAAVTPSRDPEFVARRPVSPYDSSGAFDADVAVQQMAAVLEPPRGAPTREWYEDIEYGLPADRQCEHHERDQFVHQADPRRDDRAEFCSGRCEYRALAESVLDVLRYDHRFCASCFNRLKTVTEPRQVTEWGGTTGSRYLADQDVVQEAFVGMAYPTKHAMLSVAAQGGGNEETNTAPEEFAPNDQTYRQRRNCECGVGHHAMRDWPLSKADALDAARNLAGSLTELRDELSAGSPAEAERARRWEFSRDLLLYAVGSLKSDPARQFDERRTFISALGTALRYHDETV